jgi:hypothetical protein
MKLRKRPDNLRFARYPRPEIAITGQVLQADLSGEEFCSCARFSEVGELRNTGEGETCGRSGSIEAEWIHA